MELAWQPSLVEVHSGVTRTWLDDRAWVEVLPGFLGGHDSLFQRMVSECAWAQRQRVVYDQRWYEPRLTWWSAVGEVWPDPIPDVVADLSEPVRRWLRSGRWDPLSGRAGLGGVAWRSGPSGPDEPAGRHRFTRLCPALPLAALSTNRRERALSTAARGPAGHGRPCLHTWKHSVPKVASADGPRMSITIRHSNEPPGSSGERVVPLGVSARLAS